MFQIAEPCSPVFYSVLYLSEHIHYFHSKQSANAWHFCSSTCITKFCGKERTKDNKALESQSWRESMGKLSLRPYSQLSLAQTHSTFCCLAERVWCWDLTQHWKQGVLFLIQTLVSSVTWLYSFSSLYKHYLWASQLRLGRFNRVCE